MLSLISYSYFYSANPGYTSPLRFNLCILAFEDPENSVREGFSDQYSHRGPYDLPRQAIGPEHARIQEFSSGGGVQFDMTKKL